MDMERVIQEAYDNGYLRGYAKGKADTEECTCCEYRVGDECCYSDVDVKADRPTWIPCSERLPSEQGQYLVTTYAYNNYHYVDVLSFHKGKFYEIDSEWGDVVDNGVVAWMYLPKPYGEREGE